MLEKPIGSRVRAKALAWLLTHPDESFFVRQLETVLSEDSTNLSRELARLARLGILTCEHRGKEKFYQADRRCPVFRELQALAIKTTGVADTLRTALAPLAGRLVVAFIYGSFAEGEPSADSDVDIVVIGDVSFAEVVSALARAQRKLSPEVNPTVYPPREFRGKARASDHFVSSVLRRQKIFLIGDEDDLAGLA